MATLMNRFIQFIHLQVLPISLGEKIIAVVGSFIGIAIVYSLCSQYLDGLGASLLVASLGASTMLLFAMPHGELSQPWPLIGGQTVAAITGVTAATLIPDVMLAAAAAVSLCLAAMYVLRCIHPPGGATALTAVIGGDAVTQLGYQFVLTPVLINMVSVFIVAMIINYPFAWRRYPLALIETPEPSPCRKGYCCNISHNDFVDALSKMDSFIDINEHDLMKMYDLITETQEKKSSKK